MFPFCCRTVHKGTDHMRTSGQMAGKAAPGISAYVALLTPVLTLAGCVGPIQLLSQPPATVESLEGDYLRLALCTYERLDRKDGRLRIAEPSDQDSMRIDFDPGSGQHWDLSFINEDPGRLTRVEVTSPRILEGSFSREHALAIARACAA